MNSAFSLPQEVLSSIPQDRSVSVAFTVYNSPALFPVRNTSQNMAVVSNTVVGSQVVSVQVGGIAGYLITVTLHQKAICLSTHASTLTNFTYHEKRIQTSK